MELHNIGLALSGGGIRALIFHLGVLKWMAEKRVLEEVKRISSVSGASLCIGMVYAYNGLTWPTSEDFLTTVLPSIEKVLLKDDLQISALRRLIVSPGYWNKKVNIVAKVLENKWGIHGNLSQLKGNVNWYVNCTTYETGKRFRFCRDNMGDYDFGYADSPNIPLSDVMAASAGFPILIGPYSLSTRDYNWYSYSDKKECQISNKTLHLWDGGVYDNLGLESIFKPDNGGFLRDGLNYIIVSNASSSIDDHYNRGIGFSVRNLKRLLDISMDQVVALRTRMVMNFIKQNNQGIYVKLGNTADKITAQSECSKDLKKSLGEKCLSCEEVEGIKTYPTTLRKPTENEYRLLLRHGFEVADCTYRCYQERNATVL